MKEITIKVPDKKLNFFMELVKQLGIEVTKEDTVIPEWQKEELDAALEEHKSGKANYTDWEDVKKNLFAKYKIK
jgi:organic radical activating enzyme